jgi:hypothetical protein
MCSPHIIVFRFPGEHVGFPAVCLATQGMGALLVFQNLLCEGIYSPLGFCLLGTQSLVKQKMNHKKETRKGGKIHQKMFYLTE